MAGIYLHIPFCKQACHYCDFHFSVDSTNRKELINGLMKEMQMQREYLKEEPVSTIYFGGGTPSILTYDEVHQLMAQLTKTFNIHPQSEVTLEANPDDLTLEKLISLNKAGINRLSIGIQSFSDARLAYLNRAHDASASIDSVARAREAGFKNLSIDLIYAIPGLDTQSWEQEIDQAIALEPEHISAYSLTIEKKTTFGNWNARGKLKPVDDDIAAGQLELLVQKLDQNGYHQYEVSNFARSGYESKHNRAYWKQQKYLGLGPSAHSYNGSTRQYNVANNHRYIKSLKENKLSFEYEELSRKDHVNEYLMTGLRTNWGINLEHLKQQFEYDILADHNQLINNLLDHNLAKQVDGSLILTRSGMLVADKIASDLFLIS